MGNERGAPLTPSMSFGPPTFSGVLWGAKLTSEKNTYTWKPEIEKGSPDKMQNSLFLKGAFLSLPYNQLGKNVVTVTFKNADMEDVTVPILSLNPEGDRRCDIELTFMGVETVTFKLVDGWGPVHLVGLQNQNRGVETKSDRKVSFYLFLLLFVLYALLVEGFSLNGREGPLYTVITAVLGLNYI